MILGELVRYYDLLVSNGSDIPRYGFAQTNVSGEIVLSKDGTVEAVVPLFDEKKKPLLIETPQQPKRTVGIEPAFMCDKAEYLFGYYQLVMEKGKKDVIDEAKTEKNMIRAVGMYDASALMHNRLLKDIDDDGAKAVICFFAEKKEQIKLPKEYPTGNLVFRLSGEPRFIHDRPAIKAAWERYCNDSDSSTELIECLISGNKEIPARLHGGLPGFGTDKPSIVSFNLPSFESFGKKQGDNAPISESAAFKYIAVLSELLRDDRHHTILAGDKLVFWAVSHNKPSEEEADIFSGLFSIKNEEANKTSTDSPDNPTSDAIKSQLKTIWQGKIPEGINTEAEFYILGLTANKTRAVIRFFHRSTFGDVLKNILQHIFDMKLSDYDRPIPPIRILLECAVQHEYKNIPPLLESTLIRSIVEGIPYPFGLYNSVLERTRADGDINAVRTGIIKAFLNRNDRINNRKEQITMGLNKEEKSIAYRLGRLLAVFEKAQKEALGDVNSSVTDKYLNSALATPSSVYPVLFNLFDKHISKLEQTGTQIYYQRLIGEIVDGIPSTGFPNVLSQEDQGRFLVGYYHQRQDLYTSKKTNAQEDNNNE
jgi:CRISPR-associated protein Csd1